MAKTLRMGFIGTGGIAHTHAKYLKEAGGVELVAGMDVKQENLDKFKDVWGVPGLYTDYKTMFKKEKLDAVSVCTPNFLHYQPTVDALNAGLHVMVEKPMAMNVAECKTMIQAAKKHNKHLVVGFQYRFSPAAQYMRRQVKDGVVGDVKFVRVQALRRRGIPGWGVFGRKDLQGGGPLIDIGVHIIEMAHYIMNKPKPVTVSASIYTYLGDKKNKVKAPWGSWDHKTYTVEDLAVGFVRFEDGSTMSVESSFAAHIDSNVFNVQVMGSKGGLNYDPVQLYHDHHGYMVTATPNFVGKEHLFAEKMKNFVATVRDGKPNLAPGEDGLMIQQILDGLYESAGKGHEIIIK